MPSTLRRSRRRELTLTRSFTSAIRLKVCPPEHRPMDSKNHEAFLTDCTNKPSSTIIVRRDRKFSLDIRRQRHPIHSLPREILAYVFYVGSRDDYMLPVSVSHVCRLWRNLALHTPSLWRRISFTPRLDMWAERIFRAKSCTLDIELVPTENIRPRPIFADVHTVQWYMHLVTPHINRCRSLHIAFPNYSPFLWNAALSGCCRSDTIAYAPRLEELTLIHRSNDDTKEFALFGGVAPRLHRLTLDGIRLAWLPSLFENLTYLDYTHRGFTKGHVAVYEVLYMLEVSNRLRELRICFPSQKEIVFLPEHLPSAGPVILPFLDRLHLCVDSPDIPSELYSLMTQISFPALTSLYLDDLHHSARPFPRLSFFLQGLRCSLSLKLLHVEHGWFEKKLIRSLVHVLPGLARIEVQGASASALLVAKFSVRRWGKDGFVAERVV